jgi:excinuclease ABC subunit B
VGGQVIFYADAATDSMKRALQVTGERRRKQLDYNRRMGITPRSIVKSAAQIMGTTVVADGDEPLAASGPSATELLALIADEARDPQELIALLRREMQEAADRLEFERAASLRDRIFEIQARQAVDPAGAEDHRVDHES